MAQQACDEKDHVVNLFFRQASYLFAYRQWLQMLQLETLCLQLRSKNQLSSFASPANSRKNRGRPVKKRPRKPRCHVSKYVIAIALGMSLAGAGLLVGLTIGWIFPAFQTSCDCCPCSYDRVVYNRCIIMVEIWFVVLYAYIVEVVSRLQPQPHSM